jgi:serine/threonine protein kinase
MKHPPLETEGDGRLQRLQAGLGERYAIMDRIGAGGMSVVYLAYDARHARQVAIKVMDDEVAESVGAARFLREIAIAARLQHPHILPLFDSGEADGLLFYVMPFVEGESLRVRIDREKQLSLHDACRITRQVASALTYAHSQGIVHRDIKPHNILLSHGEAIVADFGIAKAAFGRDGDSLTVSGSAVGTPVYMSPEQALGEQDVDGRSDQYALGCVVYEMLAGSPPFAGASAQAIVARHVSSPPPSITVVRPAVPRNMERAVEVALAKVPADRYATAAHFAEALEAALVGPAPEPFSRTASAMRAVATRRPINAGRLVSKTCDRWAQVNAFDSCLRTGWKGHPGRPQVFVIHGEEGQGHESLLERLLATTISRFAEELDGAERGSIVRIRAPWPESENRAVAQRDLAISVFREADPGYMDDDLSAAALRRRIAERLGRIAVIHHDIRPRYWRRDTPDLLDWYVNRFWGALDTRRGDTQFLIFLKILYLPTPSAGLLGFLRPDGSRRKRIQNALERVSADPSRCGFSVLKELQSVTLDDVKDWFSKNSLYESELQREAGAKAVFRGAGRKRMVDIEHALAEIHEAAMSAQLSQGFVT